MISRKLSTFIACFILMITASLFGNYSAFVCENESVQLKVSSGCTADDELFSYSWFKDGQMIDAETANEIVFNAVEGSVGCCEIKCIAANEFAKIDFVWDLSIVSSSGLSLNNLPQITALFQNYPNPFNPATTVSYALSKAGNVKISVYNHKGELVVNLVDDFKQAGLYNLKLDGNSLSSGTYFYHLLTDDYQATKRAVLLK